MRDRASRAIDPQNRRARRAPWGLSIGIWILLLSLLSFAIRALTLDAQPIWWDEAISIHLANASLGQIVANRAGNLHPPTYFFLLKGWRILTGDSAFSVRFLSVWFSTLLVPALYAFGRRWFNRHIGLITAALGALSPLYLVYAQEARVYAILPLAYLTLMDLTRRLTKDQRARWFVWAGLILVEALALGMHYMSLFAVAYLLGKSAIYLRRRRSDLMRLLAVQGAVALLLLPWLLAVLGHIDALGARLGMTNWQAEPVSLTHFTRLLWLFQLTGRTALLSNPLAIALTAAAGLGLIGAVGTLMARRDPRREAVELLLDWLIPLSCAFVVWKVRPLSHPRYVIIFTPPLLLLIAYAVVRLARRSYVERGLVTLLALSVLAAFALGHYAYGLPRFAKDDTRGAAAAIAAEATADDLILVPPEDWSVPYYYDGPARVEMLWPGDTPADWEQLVELTKGVETVFLVDYYRASRDPRGLLPFALESAGSMIERWDFKGLYVRVYRLEGAIVPPQLSPVDARFGPLRLIGAWVEQGTPADTALPVALRWRKEGEEHGESGPYRVNLSLQGPDHWGWAMNNDWLLNESALPIGSLEAGHEATTYHLVPLAPGTPPLTYTLDVGVYELEEGDVQALDLLDQAGNPQGQAFELTAMTLEPPLGLEGDSYRVDTQVPTWETPVEIGNGLQLEGALLDREEVGLGLPLFVTLQWRGTAALECGQPLEATVTLEREGEPLTVASGPVGGRFTCDRWAPGQTVEEHRRLEISPTTEPGMANVILRVGDRQVELGQVKIREEEHIFTPPPMEHELGVRFGDVAELLGYDLEGPEVASDEEVSITLYWRALEGADGRPYAVFTHILAGDGHLVGQHDGPPAGGRRPTPSWVPDEIIVDQHEMTFREPYAGPGRIEIGLYDPATLERVPTANGQTFVILPTELQITAP